MRVGAVFSLRRARRPLIRRSMAQAVPVAEAEAVEPQLQPAEGAANPPEDGYVRVWWVAPENKLEFLDVPDYPDLTFRELRVVLSQHASFPLLGFTLGDLDGELYPLDDHPEEGQKIICHVGAALPGTTFGPYLGPSDAVWLRISDILAPATIIGTLQVLSSAWLETLCFRRPASLRNGRPPSLTTLAHRIWVTEGPGAFFRCTAPAIVHYLFAAVLTQSPKAFILGGAPASLALGVFFRVLPAPFFLLVSPLHRAVATPMPRASFLSQLFYFPSADFTLHNVRRDLTTFGPFTVAREFVGAVIEESMEEHQFGGKWLAKRGIDPASTPVRLGIIAAKMLLLSPLYVAERYGLFYGVLTELLWSFFAQTFLAEIPLRWVMSRINTLSRRMDDPLVVRRLVVESTLGFVATSAFFATGVVWFAKKR